MGPLRSGSRGGTDWVGEYKTPGMRDSIRAQSALKLRVSLICKTCFLLSFVAFNSGRVPPGLQSTKDASVSVCGWPNEGSQGCYHHRPRCACRADSSAQALLQQVSSSAALLQEQSHGVFPLHC